MTQPARAARARAAGAARESFLPHSTRRAVVFGLGASATGLAACGQGSQATPAPSGGLPKGDVTVQWYQRRSNAALQDLENGLLAKDWTPAFPNVKVEVITEPGNNIEGTEKLTAMLAGGTPPDLVDNPMSEDGLAPQGLTQPLDDLVARDKFDLGRFVKSHIEVLAKFRNKLYGVPRNTGGNGYAMVYNRSKLAEAGVQEPPADWKSAWSWDQFREALRRLTRTSDGKVSQVGLLGYGYYALTIPIPWRAQWITADLKTITCDSPDMVDAYSKVVDLMLKDRSTGMVPGIDLGGGDAFITGRAAIHTIGNWQLTDYAKLADLDWAFMPFPRGKVSSAEFGPVLFSLAAGAKQREAGWALLKWLVDGSRYARYAGVPAPIKADAEAQLRTMFADKPKVRWEVMRDLYDVAEPLPLIRRHPAWGDMVKLTDAMWADLRAGTQAAEPALKALKPSLQAMVDQRPVPAK